MEGLGSVTWGGRGGYLKPHTIENNQPKLNSMYTGDKLCCYISIDFHSTKQGLPLVDSWSHGLDLNQMYPDRDTLSNVPTRDTLQHMIKPWWKVA